MRKSSREIALSAYRNQKAILAFNIPHLPMVEPIVRAVIDTDTFAFIELARLEWIKFEAKGAAEVIEEYKKWEDPGYMRIHLDHVPVIDEDDLTVDYVAIIKEAIELGYDSVMVDGSRLSLEDNIAATREVADLAHAAGIPCEAELGAVLGHEAGPPPPYDELFESGRGFTDVEEARRFAQESQCDWLSVAMGNIHGAVSGAMKDQKKVEARLNLDHLEKLRDATGIPLVLHGGSGIRQEYILGAIERGISKINVGTEIRQAYERTLREGGDVTKAKDAVTRRTTELIEDHFRMAGIRETILAD